MTPSERATISQFRWNDPENERWIGAFQTGYLAAKRATPTTAEETGIDRQQLASSDPELARSYERQTSEELQAIRECVAIGIGVAYAIRLAFSVLNRQA